MASLIPAPALVRAIIVASLCALAAPFALRAQDKPDLRVEDDCVVMAYAPDGRIAYSVEHMFHVKKIVYERDDIWIVTPQGSKRHIVDGEKFARGPAPFSYKVDALAWSLDGKQLTAQFTTNKLTDAKGKALPTTETLLLNDSGGEIAVSGGDSLVPAASNAVWLTDDATVAFLADPAPPGIFHSISEVVPASGKTTPLFPDHGFAAVAWDQHSNGGIAIENSTARNVSAQLVSLDLEHQKIRDLAPIEGYAGGLTISPSGRYVSYFIDPEVIEVRDLSDPRRVGRAHVAFGKYFWSANESRILLKRGEDKQQSDLVWVALPPLAVPPAGQEPSMTEPNPHPIFHDLEYPNFAISPDGHSIAVIEFGRGWLLVYPLPE
ncbi:MAG: hypothetical protein WA871_04255 [Candidatus Acidiferrales bacterium]